MTISKKRNSITGGRSLYSSAKLLKNAYPTLGDGAYLLNIPNVGPRMTYCLMNGPNGGG